MLRLHLPSFAAGVIAGMAALVAAAAIGLWWLNRWMDSHSAAELYEQHIPEARR